jgi:hypothetical protein
LVVEGFHSPLDGGLWGRSPSSDPVVLRDISWHENKQKAKSDGAGPQWSHEVHLPISASLPLTL